MIPFIAMGMPMGVPMGVAISPYKGRCGCNEEGSESWQSHCCCLLLAYALRLPKTMLLGRLRFAWSVERDSAESDMKMARHERCSPSPSASASSMTLTMNILCYYYDASSTCCRSPSVLAAHCILLLFVTSKPCLCREHGRLGQRLLS